MDITKNGVYTMKLSSGEELVTKIIDITDTEIVIYEPLSVAPGPQGIGLMLSFFTAEPKSSIRLNRNSVMMYAPTEEAVRNKYLQATTTIVVPDKKLILG